MMMSIQSPPPPEGHWPSLGCGTLHKRPPGLLQLYNKRERVIGPLYDMSGGQTYDLGPPEVGPQPEQPILTRANDPGAGEGGG